MRLELGEVNQEAAGGNGMEEERRKGVAKGMEVATCSCIITGWEI